MSIELALKNQILEVKKNDLYQLMVIDATL